MPSVDTKSTAYRLIFFNLVEMIFSRILFAVELLVSLSCPWPFRNRSVSGLRHLWSVATLWLSLSAEDIWRCHLRSASYQSYCLVESSFWICPRLSCVSFGFADWLLAKEFDHVFAGDGTALVVSTLGLALRDINASCSRGLRSLHASNMHQTSYSLKETTSWTRPAFGACATILNGCRCSKTRANGLIQSIVP